MQGEAMGSGVLIADVAVGSDPFSATVILIVIVALVAAVLAVRALMRRRTQVPGDAPPAIESERPRDVLEDRVEVERPIEITEGMSLREIKAAKRARLSEEYKHGDEVVAEKERRKGRGDAVSTSVPSVPVDTGADLAPSADDRDDEDRDAKPSESRPAAAAGSGDSPAVAPTESEGGAGAGQAPVTAPSDPSEDAAAAVVPAAPSPADAAAEPNDEAAAGEAAGTVAPDASASAPTRPTEPSPDLLLPPSPGAAIRPRAGGSEATRADLPDMSEIADAFDSVLSGGPSGPRLSVPLSQERFEPAHSTMRSSVATSARPTVVSGSRPVAMSTEPSRTLRDGLDRTRGGFVAKLGAVFSRSKVDAQLIEELEEALFTADIGARTSQRLLDAVQSRMRPETTPEGAWGLLRAETTRILEQNARSLEIGSARPFVVLVVGVNGAGKTTTIGKLAARYVAQGLSVMMVAGDTFRAAAVAQLEEWSRRVGCAFHQGADGSDPSSVIYEGLRSAQEQGIDVVLCDTAGRLHTKVPLIEELKKIHRTATKAIAGCPHETVLVLDSNTGQNAIQQAQLFSQAVPVTGIVLTKLDGTAKGGVVIGISEEMRVPIYFIGIGESVGDLRPFDATEFVDALF